MKNEFDWISKVEKGELSLARLIEANRFMENTMKKRKRGFRIAVLSGIAVAAAYVLFFFAVWSYNSRRGTVPLNRDTAIIALQLVLFTFLAFVPVFILIKYTSIDRPLKRYSAALKAAYPGIDPRSELSFKRYVWTLERDRVVFFFNLCGLIRLEGQTRVKQGIRTPSEAFLPVEQTVLDVWVTGSVAQQIVDF